MHSVNHAGGTKDCKPAIIERCLAHKRHRITRQHVLSNDQHTPGITDCLTQAKVLSHLIPAEA